MPNELEYPKRQWTNIQTMTKQVKKKKKVPPMSTHLHQYDQSNLFYCVWVPDCQTNKSYSFTL